MPLAVSCTHCGTKLKIADNLAGRSIRCTKCTKVFKVPGPAAPAAAAKLQPKAAPAAARTAPQKPAVRSPGANAPGSPAARKPAPKEEEVLDPDALEMVDEPPAEEPLDEASLEMADEEPAPKKAKGKKATLDDDEGGSGKVRPLASGEDPFEGTDIPEDYQELVREELTKGERIVWVGRPAPELMISNAKIAWYVGLFGLVPVGALLLVLGFVVHWVMLIFGPVLLLFGGIMLFMPMITRRTMPRRNVYVLTNRRCFLWEHSPGVGARLAYNGFQLDKMKRKESIRFPKMGNLIFEVVVTYDTVGSNNRPVRREEPRGFLMVDNVREVEKLIRETLIDRRTDKLVQ